MAMTATTMTTAEMAMATTMRLTLQAA